MRLLSSASKNHDEGKRARHGADTVVEDVPTRATRNVKGCRHDSRETTLLPNLGRISARPTRTKRKEEFASNN
jgi:hypothetical protein